MPTQTPTSQSYLATREGLITGYIGPDAAKCLRALLLAEGLKLYAQTTGRVIILRQMTATRMLGAATAITAKRYKRGQQAQAAIDVQRWADEMKAALPRVEE